MLASASEDGRTGRRGVLLLDTATGQKRGWVPANGPIAFSSDGKLLAVGQVRHVTVWRVPAGEPVAQSQDEAEEITDVAFSPDGKWLSAMTRQGVIRLWDAESLAAGDEQTRTLTLVALNEAGDWLAATDTGHYDRSSGGSRLLAWRLGPYTYPVDQFEEEFRRPDLVRRALAGEALPRAGALDGTRLPPQVRFAYPEYGAAVQGTTAEVILEAGGVQPLDRIELTLNGRPVLDDAIESQDIEPTEAGTFLYTLRLRLPRSGNRVRLRAVAYDEGQLRSQPAELSLRRANAQEAAGELRLLAVGISAYRHADWNTLDYADDDAVAFAEVARGDLAPTVLTNAQANITNLKFALRQLKDSATEDDTAVIFLAGHGVQVGDDYYFLAHDSDPKDLPRTALPWEDFVGVLREVRAARVILLADTCHAGLVTGSRDLSVQIDRLNRNAGVAVFAASRGGEPSFENRQWGHGAFTKALLEALSGAADANGDRQLNLAELQPYVARRVAELTDGQQHPELPRRHNLDLLTPFADVPE